MSERVDELFGSSGTEVRPRAALVVSLTLGGVVLAVGGLACSVIPGVSLVLAAWIVVQRELDRVESGFLPLTEQPGLARLRWFVWGAVALVALLALLQLAGLWTGVYAVFWSGLVRSWVETHPLPPTSTP